MDMKELLHQLLLPAIFLLGSYKFGFISLQQKNTKIAHLQGKNILSKPRSYKPFVKFLQLFYTYVFCCCCKGKKMDSRTIILH